MPQISLQLHATLDDLRSHVIRWASAQPVAIAVQQHAEAWLPQESAKDLKALPDVPGASIRIALSVGEPPSGEDPDLRGRFVVHVGALAGEGLRESAMGVVDDDSGSLLLWRKLVREIREKAHKGAAVSNPMSGDKMHLPDHPHLPGAHDLAAQGVVMLAAAGWNRYEFDDLS